MPFRSVAPVRLYQRVADQIAALIDGGELPVGSRLPAERDLALRLAVSRPVVREAMIALEIAGLVEVRTGSGTFVLRRTEVAHAAGLFAADAGTSPFDLLDVRTIVEPENAARAALATSPAAHNALSAALADMRSAGAHEEFRRFDHAFHVAVAETTGNEVLVRLTDQLWSEMFSPLFARLGTASGLFATNRAATLVDHERIVAAIRSGRPEAAAAAMRQHLDAVRSILSTVPAEEALEGTDDR